MRTFVFTSNRSRDLWIHGCKQSVVIQLFTRQAQAFHKLNYFRGSNTNVPYTTQTPSQLSKQLRISLSCLLLVLTESSNFRLYVINQLINSYSHRSTNPLTQEKEEYAPVTQYPSATIREDPAQSLAVKNSHWGESRTRTLPETTRSSVQLATSPSPLCWEQVEPDSPAPKLWHALESVPSYSRKYASVLMMLQSVTSA